MKKTKSKAILTALLVLLLVPIASGLFCTCCEAASTTQTVIQKTPCQGCCPGTNLVSDSCERLGAEKFVLTSFFKDVVSKLFQSLNVTGNLSQILDSSRHEETHLGRQDYFSPPVSEPLYLTLQVFRL